MRQRLHLPALQWIGLPLMLVMPALALAGAFDPHTARSRTSLGELEIEIEASDRVRLHRSAGIEVEVRNTGARAAGAEVALSPELLEGAQAIDFVPSPHRAWAVRLDAIAPGEARRVVVEYEADAPGVHRGALHVRDDEGREVRAPLQTIVFP